jgi:hypothetical protein
VADQLGVVGDAVIGQPVGQQQAAPDGFAIDLAPHLLATGEPAGAEIGGAAGLDAAEPLGGPVEGRGARPGARRDYVDLVVVHHHREAVAGAEQRERAVGRLARQVQLPTTHGARTVEHQRQVDRQSVLAARRLGRGERHPHVARARRGGTDQGAIGLGVQSHEVSSRSRLA